MQVTPFNAFARALVAAFAGLAMGCSLQVDNQSEPAVTVRGETTLRRPAEVFEIEGVIRARAVDRDATLAQVAETLRGLRDAIGSLRGLETLAFTADDMEVETVRPFGCAAQFRGEQRPVDCAPIAYSAVIPFRVRGGPRQAAGDAASLLAERGAEAVRLVSFDVADPDGMRAQARRQAVLEALQTAEELAANSGAALGPVISIDYGDVGYPPSPRARLAQPEDIVATGLRTSPRASIRLTPEDIEVTERVTVVFELRERS